MPNLGVPEILIIVVVMLVFFSLFAGLVWLFVRLSRRPQAGPGQPQTDLEARVTQLEQERRQKRP